MESYVMPSLSAQPRALGGEPSPGSPSEAACGLPQTPRFGVWNRERQPNDQSLEAYAKAGRRGLPRKASSGPDQAEFP